MDDDSNSSGIFIKLIYRGYLINNVKGKNIILKVTEAV